MIAVLLVIAKAMLAVFVALKLVLVALAGVFVGAIGRVLGRRARRPTRRAGSTRDRIPARQGRPRDGAQPALANPVTFRRRRDG